MKFTLDDLRTDIEMKTRQNATVDMVNEKLKVPNFDPSDPIYKIWCDCRIIPAFLFLLSVQFLLSSAAFVFSLYQIISIENLHKIHHDADYSTRNFTVNKSTNFISSHFEITFFLCQHWYPLIYVRFLALTSVLFCIFVAFYGVKSAKISCIKIYSIGIMIFIAFLLTYVALLAWYAIKNDDYFSFCFVGLTLLMFLLLNVSALHIGSVLCKFMKNRQKFIDYVVERGWFDEGDDDSDRKGSKKSTFCANFLSKYDVSDELQAKVRRENGDMDENHYRLCEIEEEDDDV